MRNTHSYKNSNPKNNTTKHSIPSVQSPQANSPSLKTPSNISDSTTTNNNQEIDLYATIGHKSLNQQENATKFPPGYKRTSDVQPIDNPIITNEFINVHTPPISQVKPSDNEYTSKIMPLPPGQLNSNTCFSQQDNTTENNNQSDRAQVQNQGGHGSRTPPHIESVSRQPTESKKTPSPPHNGNIQLKDSNTKPEQQSSIMTSSKLPIPQSFGVSRRDSLKKK
ncbi:MAG: hypothetical protein EZS28_021131 [Streblomastix strix]|uniref:Uncharacterized protein n=1 Tax=Streblomastix strix TaxID=222440 RepID=A0A5J4VL87_9EUKA|nr:MAG: hypothetical protein EZS28_021131 [Streblomastix strix]